MTAVQQIDVAADEDGLRLDRWFKRHFPALGHGRLEKLLRTGQVRVDGGRAKANARLIAGQQVRVPPLGDLGAARLHDAERPKAGLSAADSAFVQGLVIHRDASVLVLNKPAGLAVQGGTKTERHLDGMLDALTFDAAERPRLVHRLDRDTSGVLVLARTAKAATALGRAFKEKDARKIYWALTAGVPRPAQGTMNVALAKQGREGGERVAPAEMGEEGAQSAVTHYAVVARAGQRLAWVAFMPMTGRTHQLRAHAVALGTPVTGDGKYGGAAAHPGGEIPRQLHLHARSIDIAHPDGGRLRVSAPLPPHMARSWALLGFDAEDDEDPFAELVQLWQGARP